MKADYAYIPFMSDEILFKMYNIQFDKINKICSAIEELPNKPPKRLVEALKKERELGNVIEDTMYKRGLIQY